MKNNMVLNVEFLAGTTIEAALQEAITKAHECNLAYVCFNFNGVSFSIGQYANIDRALALYPAAKYICEP